MLLSHCSPTVGSLSPQCASHFSPLVQIRCLFEIPLQCCYCVCAHICTKYTHMFMDQFYLGSRKLVAEPPGQWASGTHLSLSWSSAALVWFWRSEPMFTQQTLSWLSCPSSPPALLLLRSFIWRSLLAGSSSLLEALVMHSGICNDNYQVPCAVVTLSVILNTGWKNNHSSISHQSVMNTFHGHFDLI